MPFTCTKRYGAEQGLSCVFRQHRAKSHCAQAHGYALAFEFEFSADNLDHNGWVVDFGSLKPLKEWLQNTFDHRMLVAEDDPMLPQLEGLADQGFCNLHVVPRTGCEAFAKAAGEWAQALVANQTDKRARVVRCTVSEHAGNSATWWAV